MTASPQAAAPTAPGHGAAGAPAVALHGLRKVYGRTVALHGLDLHVERGEVFGLLGPNGAGKTTAVKALVGLVRPTAGRAELFGRPAGDPGARARVGYLPELFRFQDWMTGAQLLDYHGRLLGLDATTRAAEGQRTLELVGLADRGGERIRGYSKGMAQRIGLAQALLGPPTLVLLDEPTSALDPVGRRDVRDLIRHLRDQGTTVLLNSHLLSEVEQVCDRVAVVDRGRVVFEGRLDELTDTAPHLNVTVDRVDAALHALLTRHGQVVDVAGTTVTLRLADVAQTPAVAGDVVAAGYRLGALVPQQRSLEEAFVGLVERGGRT